MALEKPTFNCWLPSFCTLFSGFCFGILRPTAASFVFGHGLVVGNILHRLLQTSSQGDDSLRSSDVFRSWKPLLYAEASIGETHADAACVAPYVLSKSASSAVETGYLWCSLAEETRCQRHALYAHQAHQTRAWSRRTTENHVRARAWLSARSDRIGDGNVMYQYPWNSICQLNVGFFLVGFVLLCFIFALQEHRKMKKLLLFILLFIIACCVAMFLLQPDQREPQERFREGMNFEQFSV